jgi:hypothetical protein
MIPNRRRERLIPHRGLDHVPKTGSKTGRQGEPRCRSHILALAPQAEKSDYISNARSLRRFLLRSRNVGDPGVDVGGLIIRRRLALGCIGVSCQLCLEEGYALKQCLIWSAESWNQLNALAPRT